MNDALRTLLFPFERGLVEPPRDGARVLLFGAGAGLSLPADLAAGLEVVQGFRSDFLALRRAGFSVSPRLEEGGAACGAALLLLGRHRRENEQRLAAALACLRPGGLLLAAGTKRDGAPAVARRLSSLLPLEGRLAKHHGIVFWLRRPHMLDTAALAALAGTPARTPEGYETAAGGFSEGSVDPGSRFLADNLPAGISGQVADFAAGWGYLSLRLARDAALAALDIYEAHHASLEAARRNMTAHAPGLRCRFFWHDLLSEPVENRYDVIVMNPPFHRSRAAEPDMGRAMIAVAARALRAGGRLYLVANRALPYEQAIQAAFPRHGELCRDAAYKVLWGAR
ncbi:class I SAM-dependent methyltransferase [Chelativorans intermedius]|uniref:Class I SAM-dependent methyltransferase n=1 Tax=Chelativorans intermedius TaxID=515947 RepID=A0ABV6D9N9_9HYPH|nr:class I SAM-dependent methyltransferase [Chelativorans intermedius]MCT8999142.1 class I SAM-dependent methyltransferase [Chelativorans intermedius]